MPIVLFPPSVVIPTFKDNVIRMGCKSSVVAARNQVTEINSPIICAATIATRLVVVQIFLIYFSQFSIN